MTDSLRSWTFTPVASLEVLVNWHPILTGQNLLGWPAKAKLSLAIAEQVNSGEVWIPRPNWEDQFLQQTKAC